MGAQQIFIHPRLVVEALGEGVCAQFHQIVIASLILRKQDQMIVHAAGFNRFVLAVLANVRFAANYGPYAMLAAHMVKMGDPKHVAMIGDGACRHAKIAGLTA